MYASFWRYSVPFWCYFVPCRFLLLPFFTLFWALLSYFTLVYAFLSQNQKYAHFQGWNDQKNYWKPINGYFWNYRPLINIKKWKFEIIKSQSQKFNFSKFLPKECKSKITLLALLPWRVVLIQYWYSCTDSYVINFCAGLCLFDAILCPVDVFCCLFTLV